MRESARVILAEDRSEFFLRLSCPSQGKILERIQTFNCREAPSRACLKRNQLKRRQMIPGKGWIVNISRETLRHDDVVRRKLVIDDNEESTDHRRTKLLLKTQK